MSQDSLKKRYLYKLSTNLVGLAISLVTQSIIPRGLGPRAYGDFNFLTSNFTQVLGFFDMGTSIAFYTKLSQRQTDSGLKAFYLSFALIVCLLLLTFVALMNVTSAHAVIWPGQQKFFISLAAILGALIWLSQILEKMCDAHGLTVSSELVRIAQKAIGLGLILPLFLLNLLDLSNFFFYNYLTTLVLGFGLLWVIERKGFSLKTGWPLSGTKVKSYAKEFYQYSNPLFVHALVGLCAGVLDRWFLQVFSGSVQQGFYGISYQVAAACSLFTVAMTPLITREFSIAYAKQDLTQMAYLFRRYIPLLYGIAAFFSCFIAVQADKVAYIFGGAQFRDAALPIAIMAFYPINQAYGQLSGSVFYATSQTGLYRNISVTFLIIGSPLAYFLIAPADKMGLNAGSTGLAIKMVLVQFVAVNVQLYFNSKFLQLPFSKYFAHQIVCVGTLLLLALLSLKAVDYIQISSNIVINFLLSGVVYTIFVTGFTFCVPSLFGLRREDIHSVLQPLLKGVRK